MYFVFSIIFLFMNFCNLTATHEIKFSEASKEDVFDLQNHLISFYAQDLFQAGIYKELSLAVKAAEEEIFLKDANHQSKKIQYFDLFLTNISDKKCGYIAYSVDEGTAYLEFVHLDFKYRGFGLGTLVLNHLELHLKEMGIKAVKLYVFAHNEIAFNLYKKTGYVVENAYFNDEAPIGYVMNKIFK